MPEFKKFKNPEDVPLNTPIEAASVGAKDETYLVDKEKLPKPSEKIDRSSSKMRESLSPGRQEPQEYGDLKDIKKDKNAKAKYDQGHITSDWKDKRDSGSI